MTTTLLEIGSYRDVHDIEIKTSNGRRCTIDIYKINNNEFESEVTILDNVSNASGSWVYKTKPRSSSALDNFTAAIELIKIYISQADPSDKIEDIHNPCNTPFISENDQNSILKNQSIHLRVRIN